ncbi:MAG: SufD family Fe-S cluster assembly protein [Oscillospiraceae bacterium]|nr:SufD family Fe-S cluster assembly protein [Oscillospiraceae bacterium]
MNKIEEALLEQVADLHGVPEGAYNIRRNGESAGRRTTENIDIVTKTDRPGIEVHIKPHTVNESVHIPVLLTATGLNELVYNDFYIGEGCDITIVAGCGIHNDGDQKSEHSGIHTFYIGKNARVRYVEKHYGQGEGTGERVMNPKTVAYLDEGAVCRMENTQIRGVDSTNRTTRCVCKAGSELLITEKLLTHGRQTAESRVDVILNGEGAKAQLTSRTVAQDESVQVFHPNVEGNAACFGHVQCDSIIMGQAKVRSVPAITANHVDAQLIHEAAIGKIAGDQILKLMTLGLTEEEAEEEILNGFLK